jgi:hypothetical protein
VKLAGPIDADTIMPFVAQLDGLQELSMGGSVRLSDAGASHLVGLTRLKTLRLPNNDQSRITGEGLKAVADLFRLQRLELCALPLTDSDFEPIRGLTDLRELKGLSPKLTDAGMSHLSALAQLRRLDLSWTKITSAGLVHLRGMSHLRLLDLDGTRVTDTGLSTLAGLPALSGVRLVYASVSDAGRANFRKDRRGKRDFR